MVVGAVLVVDVVEEKVVTHGGTDNREGSVVCGGVRPWWNEVFENEKLYYSFKTERKRKPLESDRVIGDWFRKGASMAFWRKNS